MVLPQILQKYPLQAVDEASDHAPPVATCGQLRAVPIRYSSSPITLPQRRLTSQQPNRLQFAGSGERYINLRIARAI